MDNAKTLGEGHDEDAARCSPAKVGGSGPLAPLNPCHRLPALGVRRTKRVSRIGWLPPQPARHIPG